MFRLIPLLILILDVVAVIDIINSSKDNEKKILWTVLVIFLPLLGPILWYTVGKK
jgi:hypothetical protein